MLEFIKLYSPTGIAVVDPLTDFSGLTIKEELNSLRTLEVTVPIEQASKVKIEGYLECENYRYVIKEISRELDSCLIYAIGDAEALQHTTIKSFISKNLSSSKMNGYQAISKLIDLVNDAQSTQWSVAYGDTAASGYRPTLTKNFSYTYQTAWSILMEITDKYHLELDIDTKNHRIKVYAPKRIGDQTALQYFYEDLNLISFNRQYFTDEIINVVYPYGKNNLSIYPSAHNHSYLLETDLSGHSSFTVPKHIKGFYIDADEDNANDLKSAALDWLEERCKPTEQFSVMVRDLYNIDPSNWSTQEIKIGDLIRVRSSDFNQTLRVVSITRNPNEPESTQLELSSKRVKLEKATAKDRKFIAKNTDTFNDTKVGETILIGDEVIATENVQSSAITTDLIADDAVDNNKLAAGSVNSSNIVDYAIISDKIADGSVVQIKLANNSVTEHKIVDGAITGVKVSDGTLTNSKIADSTITGGKIANATITNANIANGTITNTQIANGTITSTEIQDSTITGSKIANGTIDGTKITDATISGSKITDTTITGSKLSNGTITATQIADSTLTGAKIVDATIGTAKIADAAITNAKIDSINGTKIMDGTVVARALSNELITTLSNTDVYYSATQPTSAKEGDLWYKTVTGADDRTDAVYVYKNNQWVEKTLDASMFTASTITTRELAAECVTAAKVDIDDLQANIASIGDPTAEHISIDNNSVDIMNGTNLLASFDADGLVLSDLTDKKTYLKEASRAAASENTLTLGTEISTSAIGRTQMISKNTVGGGATGRIQTWTTNGQANSVIRANAATGECLVVTRSNDNYNSAYIESSSINHQTNKIEVKSQEDGDTVTITSPNLTINAPTTLSNSLTSNSPISALSLTATGEISGDSISVNGGTLGDVTADTLSVNGVAIKGITTVEKSASITASANAYSSITDINISKSGYTPIGIVGVRFSGTGSTYITLARFWLSGTNTAGVAVRSVNSVANTITVYLNVLYLKN